MSRALDAQTDSQREQELMRRVRSGELDEAGLERWLPAFPLKIQLQTASPCNAACQMCPWPQTRETLPQGSMSNEVFDLFEHQVRGQPVERLSLFLMNEPLIDRRLEGFIRRLKQALPRADQVIYTNGSLLSGERAEALAEAGLDELSISVIGFESESYRRLMGGLGFERALQRLTEVGQRLAAGRLGNMRVRVVGLDFPEGRAGMQAFAQQTGLPIYLNPLTNRAGNVAAEDFLDPTDLAARRGVFRACQRPFVKAYVLYTGQVVLCNCDWERSTIVGDIRQQTLAEIWRGPALNAIRRAHISARLPADSLCARCDYPFIE